MDESNLEIELAESITSAMVGDLWEKANDILESYPDSPIVVNASNLTFVDISGVAFLSDLQTRFRPPGAEISIIGLSASLAELVPPSNIENAPQIPRGEDGFFERVGNATREMLVYVGSVVRFIKECVLVFKLGINRRKNVNWTTVSNIATRVGADAVPIILLIGFLMGVIIAFEIGLVAQQFGAVLFVADGIGISMFRELGPLMTAIVFAGRTGAAFAAEIGTQKVNEEINALHTFGICPVEFLVIPRIYASVLVLPLLTVLADIIGVLGGALVLLKFDISFVQYYHQLLNALSVWDLFFGLIKATTFGFIIAVIGCERGLATGQGSTSVGLAATSAVVSSIIWIVVIDGFFTVLLT
ncbi:MlaE family lipid ABC transporter permease subunit [Vibrio parahaemolyticus]|uniref:ABC transporter permease n=1 Tax=Vibrio parahaemolyticus TaxID=670 RepID=UPI0010D31B57|nr:MlaE family lipid ABC transporter permease subunit [Vibrio parahaemolyticus]EGQ8071073.1 MlaE family lipid ABC transporter permease subunit [Vibrio parahaemolyticus]EIU7056500.1 MlaE family lipid ABC transporter permease subunit [Vibrio parahaemolyticus]MBE4477776.1 MlaE family lipid ABC transporter permease subunit [Vibrio parahaemolyticus]TBT46298.1 MlaE family lipid ABC transporter permease subunit [Vibrio parahaemolyticus]TOZ99852.1 MlaE family lipid ABC transporter permease subunit [Vi